MKGDRLSPQCRMHGERGGCAGHDKKQKTAAALITTAGEINNSVNTHAAVGALGWPLQSPTTSLSLSPLSKLPFDSNVSPFELTLQEGLWFWLLVLCIVANGEPSAAHGDHQTLV